MGSSQVEPLAIALDFKAVFPVRGGRDADARGITEDKSDAFLLAQQLALPD